MSTLYVPALRVSATSQYTCTLCSSPVYSMSLRMLYSMLRFSYSKVPPLVSTSAVGVMMRMYRLLTPVLVVTLREMLKPITNFLTSFIFLAALPLLLRPSAKMPVASSWLAISTLLDSDSFSLLRLLMCCCACMFCVLRLLFSLSSCSFILFSESICRT